VEKIPRVLKEDWPLWERFLLTLFSLSSMNCLAAAEALSACLWAASQSACTWARRETSIARRRTTLKQHISHINTNNIPPTILQQCCTSCFSDNTRLKLDKHYMSIFISLKWQHTGITIK